MKNINHNKKGTKDKEYAELMKMAENAGIADLMKLYEEYSKLLELSNIYMQQMNQRFSFSTTNSSA
jgi:hypothetical protein